MGPRLPAEALRRPRAYSAVSGPLVQHMKGRRIAAGRNLLRRRSEKIHGPELRALEGAPYLRTTACIQRYGPYLETMGHIPGQNEPYPQIWPISADNGVYPWTMGHSHRYGPYLWTTRGICRYAPYPRATGRIRRQWPISRDNEPYLRIGFMSGRTRARDFLKRNLPFDAGPRRV